MLAKLIYTLSHYICIYLCVCMLIHSFILETSTVLDAFWVTVILSGVRGDTSLFRYEFWRLRKWTFLCPFVFYPSASETVLIYLAYLSIVLFGFLVFRVFRFLSSLHVLLITCHMFKWESLSPVLLVLVCLFLLVSLAARKLLFHMVLFLSSQCCFPCFLKVFGCVFSNLFRGQVLH